MVTSVAVYGRQSKDKTKSIDEQTAACEADAQAQGWTVAALYSDGVSASRFATKTRKDWPRLLADLDTGRLGALVLWESSRGDRNLTTWSALLDLCRARGVLIRITSHGRTYDMSNERDWRTLAEDGVDSAVESGKISTRQRRATAAAAAAGRPHGRTRYGYERVYDPATGELTGEQIHAEQADVVRYIVRLAGRSVPLSAITENLNATGVPAPGGGRWVRSRVRALAMSPAYVGQRLHNGEAHAAIWPAIVTEPDHLTALRVLGDPARKVTRPGRQVWMLSYLVRCRPCGDQLVRRKDRYSCMRGCVSINAAELDGLVLDLAARYLADEDVTPPSDDAQALAARAEADRLQTELDDWRDSGARGETSPASLARIEPQLLARIKDAHERAQRASMPAVLREVLDGAAGSGRYRIIRARLGDLPVAGQREIIGSLLRVRIDRAGRRATAAAPIELERVLVEWVSGDDRG